MPAVGLSALKQICATSKAPEPATSQQQLAYLPAP